jgi:DNA-binding response OmpR family regulator
MMGKRRILVIDDQPEIGRLICALGESFGLRVEVTSDAESFKSAFEAEQPDLLVVDMAIPNFDGIELLTFLSERSCRSSILIISGIGRTFLSVASRFGQLRGLKILGTMSKPLRSAELETIFKTLRVA